MTEDVKQKPRQRYGTGAFEKYPGVWYARFTDETGRQRVLKAGAKSTAVRLYRRMREQVLQGKRFPEDLRKGVKFETLAQAAIDRTKRSGKKPGKLALVKKWFAGRNAADVTPQDVERELNRLRRRGHRFRDRGLAQATLNRFRAAVSAIYSLALRDGKVLSNPARLVKMERENNARVRFLSQDEEVRLRAKIREACPEREAELDLALHTGMRRGEQYSLRWDDVDLVNGVITIAKGKGDKKRYLPINPDALAALASLKRSGNGSGSVCPGGMTKRGYQARWFERAAAAAGINDFRWHDLRHTFASRLRMRGVELATIKELLGHTTLQMVLRYAHLAPGYLKAAVDTLTTKTPEVPAAGAWDVPTAQRVQ